METSPTKEIEIFHKKRRNDKGSGNESIQIRIRKPIDSLELTINPCDVNNELFEEKEVVLERKSKSEVFGIHFEGGGKNHDPIHVACIQDASLASMTDLKVGDILLRVNGFNLIRQSAEDLSSIIHRSGNKVKVVVLRLKRTQDLHEIDLYKKDKILGVVLEGGIESGCCFDTGIYVDRVSKSTPAYGLIKPGDGIVAIRDLQSKKATYFSFLQLEEAITALQKCGDHVQVLIQPGRVSRIRMNLKKMK